MIHSFALRSALAPLIILGAAPFTARAQQPSPPPARPRVVARMAGGPIQLDGRLDDPAWALADSIADLRQREPSEGETPTERTVVKVLRDPENLYVAMRAYQRDTSTIIATQYRRDADLDVNDNIGFGIDSYNDQRSLFGFATNPNGEMWDGQFSGQYDWNVSWNGIWYVAVTRDSLGWTAEFQIPFRTLRFQDGTDVVMGFNVRRYIRSKNEEDLWQAWLRNQGIERLQFEGDLVIADALVRGADVELRPNGIFKYSLPEYAAESSGVQTAPSVAQFKLGVDAKLAVTPTMTADLTANADFAEVEADSQVINLTRFPVFFPEKREFFLESSELFTFGTVSPARTQLFYSRRIGLTDSGVVVPILIGGRMYGNAGNWTVGALAAQTGSPESATDAVLRLKRNVLERSYLGMIATMHNTPDGGVQAAGGFDADFPLVVKGKNIGPKFWIAGSNNPGTPGTPIAWRAYLDYPNDIWDNFLALYRVEKGFAPSLGFVLRDGINETNGHVNWLPRPSSGAIRNYDIQFIDLDIITGDSGALTNSADWIFAHFDVRPFGFQLQSGDRLTFDISRDLDAPDSAFYIYDSSSIAAGRYWWTRVRVAFELSPGRIVSGALGVSWGGFYNGTATILTTAVAWRSGGHFMLGGDLAISDVHLPGGNFTAVQSALRLEYNFNTRLSLLGFAQQTNDAERADFQFRLHWIPVVGDDVYVVWNSGYTTAPLARWRFPATDALSHQINGALVFKVVHRIPL